MEYREADCVNNRLFYSLSSCINSCKEDNPAKYVLTGNSFNYKAVKFYENDCNIIIRSDIEKICSFLPSQDAILTSKNYVFSNRTLTVCYPMSKCFQENNFYVIPPQDYHQMDHDRVLWVKPIRQLASYGEYFLVNNFAHVCSPKLSDFPLDVAKGILCVISALFLLSTILNFNHSELTNRFGLLYFKLNLFLSFICKAVYYLSPCPMPIFLYFDNFFFNCAILWLTAYSLQLIIDLKSSKGGCNRVFSFKHLIAVILPVVFGSGSICWLTKIYQDKYHSVFERSCIYPRNSGLYISAILRTIIIGVLIFNSVLLHLCRLEIGSKSFNPLRSLLLIVPVRLCIASSIYTTLKLICDVIAIEEVFSTWMFVDVLSEIYGVFVSLIFYHKCYTSHDLFRGGSALDSENK